MAKKKVLKKSVQKKIVRKTVSPNELVSEELIPMLAKGQLVDVLTKGNFENLGKYWSEDANEKV